MTPNEERAVEALNRHGFRPAESRAYVALLQENPATGYQLSSRAGVPRSAIYDVLRRLNEMGAVQAVNARPARYIPVAPQQLERLLEMRFQHDLNDLRDCLARLATDVPEVLTQTFDGYANVLSHARALIEEAERAVHLSGWPKELAALRPSIAAAEAEGRQVVVFGFASPGTNFPGRVLSYGIPEEVLRPSWSPRLTVVRDASEVLIANVEHPDVSRGLVTSDSALVEVAINNLVLDVTLFGQRRGEEVSSVVGGLVGNVAPIDEWLAEHPSEERPLG